MRRIANPPYAPRGLVGRDGIPTVRWIANPPYAPRGLVGRDGIPTVRRIANPPDAPRGLVGRDGIPTVRWIANPPDALRELLCRKRPRFDRLNASGLFEQIAACRLSKSQLYSRSGSSTRNL
ncbi:MAG: hypothetical protein KJ606_07070 [Chloroflexi bacterium]|nr:hypothetical protein [Chloroflexota bacterium]